MSKDKNTYGARFFQTVESTNINRSEHVWLLKDGIFKCVLCGAVCCHPPPYRAEGNWLPERYEKLTIEEREQCPFVNINTIKKK